MAATSSRHLPGNRYLNPQNPYNSSQNTGHLGLSGAGWSDRAPPR